MSARLKRGDAVLVVAEKLANGAPHPLFGVAGRVVRARAHSGLFPVRVHIAGRAVMFAPDELERVDEISQDEMIAGRSR